MSRATSPLRDRMIFIVGARRSGTNWLQRVVGAHPAVALVPSETYLFSRGIAPLSERFHHGVRGSPATGHVYMDEAELLDGLRDFCDRALAPFLNAVPGAIRLAERTPEHVTCLGLIGRLYPDAHVVHIIRDGRDVARSLLSQGWSTAPRSIEEAAEEWRYCVDAAEAASGKLERMIEVRYEELLTDPLRLVTDLYSSLGLTGGRDVVEAALIEAEVRFNVAPGGDVAAGKWRNSFSADDLDAFMRVAGDALRRLGYDTTGTVSSAIPPGTAERPPRLKKRRLRRRRESVDASADPAFERSVTALVASSQRTVDRVVEALNTRDVGTLAGLMTGSVWVQFVSPDEEWKGRGPAAWDRLAAAIGEDEALGGRQVRGDVYPSLPASTAVMIYETADGVGHVRVVAVTLHGERIARFSYYRLPLAR